MDSYSGIPSIADLALQYGTINKKQFQQVSRLYNEKKAADNGADYDQLLLSQKLATGYQIGLLKLIREYLIIKKRGEAFGKIAVEKGFATQEDVDRALEHQKKEFKRAKIKKLIGDILVESRVITVKQKNAVLKEQTFVDEQADQIFTTEESATAPEAKESESEIKLSDYDKKFLKVKALDKEFAASLIEKKMASERQVQIAQKVQEEDFETQTQIRLLGDIMVEMDFISDEQKNQILEEQKRTEKPVKDGSEKKLQLEISPDRMEAVVRINPEAKEPVTLADIKQSLILKKIKYGIYPDSFIQCALELNRADFTVARQDFSQELINLRKATFHFTKGGIDPEIKNKGATLLEHHTGSESFVKKDLFGQDIEQEHQIEETFRCAAGTRYSKDNSKIFAAKTGFPSLSIERKLFVHPAISVLEDADLRYGPLELYANLSISGVLTGAYPVTAGNIKAREIRGAQIDAIGTIHSEVGITDTVIRTQGDVHARYLHNCRIETFGNVYIDAEMIDTRVYCSGKIESANCRIISTALYAKKGIEILGAGSSKTPPCILASGTEHHVMEKAALLDSQIRDIRLQLDSLREQMEEQAFYSKKTFQKMIELKIFHDRAKKKKEKLSQDFKKNKNKYDEEKLDNIVKLIRNFERRKKSSLANLKEMNEIKKRYDKKKSSLLEKIEKLEPKIIRQTKEIKKDMMIYFEWERKQQNVSTIKIHRDVFQGTILKGIFSSLELEKNHSAIHIFEQKTVENNFQLTIQKIS